MGPGQMAWAQGMPGSAHSTCSSSCRSRWSWDSSCLLWSSKICILASSRPLCCLRSFASAISSESSDVWWGDTTESGGEPTGRPLLKCCSFSCSYSTCRFLVGKQKLELVLDVSPSFQNCPWAPNVAQATYFLIGKNIYQWDKQAWIKL